MAWLSPLRALVTAVIHPVIVNMPFTDSGLWVPSDLPKPNPPWWRRILGFLVRGFTMPVILSLLSLVVATVSVLTTRANTELSQRAYLAYQIHTDDQQKNTTLFRWRLELQNLGNTPARSISISIASNNGSGALNMMDGIPLPFDLRSKESRVVGGWSASNDDISFLSILGYVEYWDVFGSYHRDIVCYTVSKGLPSPLLADCTHTDIQY